MENSAKESTSLMIWGGMYHNMHIQALAACTFVDSYTYHTKYAWYDVQVCGDGGPALS